LCLKRGGRVMTVTQLIKGKPKYGISKSGRILFLDIRYGPTRGVHGSVFFSSSAHSQALYILRTILQSSAHSSFFGPMFLSNSKKVKGRKLSDGSITVHKNNFIQFPVSDHPAWPSHNYHSKRLL